MYVRKQPRRVKNIQLLKNSRFYVFGVSTTFQKSNSILLDKQPLYFYKGIFRVVYHLKIPSFTICLQLKKNILSLLLPIQKPLEHLKISPFTIYLHSNSIRISSEAVLKSDCQNRLGGSNNKKSD